MLRSTLSALFSQAPILVTFVFERLDAHERVKKFLFK